MNTNLVTVRTKQPLLDALNRSSKQKISAEELLEQQVSFVYSSVSQDSNVTKEEIRKVLDKNAGRL